MTSLVLSFFILSAPCTQAAPADTGKAAVCTGVILPTQWVIDGKKCCRLVKVYEEEAKRQQRWAWVRPAGFGFASGLIVALGATVAVFAVK